MSETERMTLAALPDTLTVLRGTSYRNSVRGFSWTLDRGKAVWFACRDSGVHPQLTNITASKRNVLAYFMHRKENEVVLMPAKLRGLRTENLPRKGCRSIPDPLNGLLAQPSGLRDDVDASVLPEHIRNGLELPGR